MDDIIEMSHVHVYHRNSFLTVNPWFDLYLRDSQQKLLRSSEFQYRVSNVVSDKLPDLMRMHITSSEFYLSLKNRMDSHADTCVNKITNITEVGLSRLAGIIDNRAKVLIESKDFEPLQSSIRMAVLEQNKQADAARDKALNAMRIELNDVKHSQIAILIGGIVAGFSLGFIAVNK